MEWLTDEVLYYGGMAVAAAAFLGLLVCRGIWKIQMIRLNAQLDAEYGERNKK